MQNISTLLQKHCNKKQETEEFGLKLCGYIDHHGTYTLLWGVVVRVTKKNTSLRCSWHDFNGGYFSQGGARPGPLH